MGNVVQGTENLPLLSISSTLHRVPLFLHPQDLDWFALYRGPTLCNGGGTMIVWYDKVLLVAGRCWEESLELEGLVVRSTGVPSYH